MAVGRALSIGARLVFSLVVSAASAQDAAERGDPARQSQETPPAKPKKDPRAKLGEPWPEPEKLRERREEAEALRLFRDADPLPFTLTADFKAFNKDRNPKSSKRFPAVLSVAGDDGVARAIPVELRTRGHSRLVRNCGFVPIRVEFPKRETKGTPFDDQESLKLVTHCHGPKDYEQLALREYLAYRIFNLLTPHSFRVRLAKGTYVDVKSGETLLTRYAMFLEAESDLARRLEGRIAELPRCLFSDLDQETLTRMMLFAYMIGNTDFSIYALHNVRLVQNPARKLYPVPYDLDYSGFVDAPYAVPARRLGLKSVAERLHRGPCRPLPELEPFLAELRQKQGEVVALIDSVPGLDSGSRRHAKRYLEEFYETIARPGSAKRELVDTCTKKAGM